MKCVSRFETKIFSKLVRLCQSRLGIGVDSNSGKNGEANVLRSLSEYFGSKDTLQLFDVGANRGGYTSLLLSAFPHATVHAFEPAGQTFKLLSELHGTEQRVVLNNVGLGSESGKMSIFYDREGSGLTSLYQRDLNHIGVELNQSETIVLTTIDEYCENKRIQKLDFMKVDVEGHELEVFKGARRMLEQSRIHAIQFEFGGCNIDSGTYFKDFWKLLHEQYHFYRITQRGIVHLYRYTESHEQFGYQNIFLKLRSLQE